MRWWWLKRWRQRWFAWMLWRWHGSYERLAGEHKRALLGRLRGEVLEIGAGTGVNLPYYHPEVRWVGVEPNPFMHKYAKRTAARLGRPIELHRAWGEELPFEEGRFDAVVSTLVLCSVEDMSGVLWEVYRVLKAGGQFVFLEHVAAKEGTRLARVQHRIKPLWRVLGDGCEPDRRTWLPIEEAGFEDVRIERLELPLPVVRPHIAGVARK